MTRGFDLYFGTDVPNWPPYCFIENDRTVGFPPNSFFAPARQTTRPAMQGRRWRTGPSSPSSPRSAIARPLSSSESAAGETRPFFSLPALTSPHTPLSVNEEWKGKSGLNLYADFVMETDAVIGRVLEALEQSGAAGNTLVVFTADNGLCSLHRQGGPGKNGPLPERPPRGAKADAWEGGHRVPFLVRWPGVVETGQRLRQLVHQADLLRTFAEILGNEHPGECRRRTVSAWCRCSRAEGSVREHAP